MECTHDWCLIHVYDNRDGMKIYVYRCRRCLEEKEDYR